ncbi:hypothetical protein Tco_1116901, partial [Tanacetum coccineum]
LVLSLGIESIADHTGAKKKIFGKKSVVEPHLISIDEYNDSDSEYTRIIKKTKVKRTTISVASKRKNMGKTMTDVKKKNKKFDDVEESKSDISTVEKKEKIKMVLSEKYLKKKGKLVAKESKITKKDLKKKGKMVLPIDEDEELTDEDDREYLNSKKFRLFSSALKSILNADSIDAKVDFKSKDGVTEDDIWVDNGKSIVPFDDFYIMNSDSLLLETQSGENNTQSVDMQFDEITVQDDADKKMVKERRFNVIKQLENDIGVETSNTGIELVNDLTKILSPKVDISDMQIGLPGVVRNDGEISIEPECFYGIKLI